MAGLNYGRGGGAADVTVDAERCNACGLCVRVCKGAPLYLDPESGRVLVDQSRVFGCIACGHCMVVCPHDAITVRGRDFGPEDMLALPPARRTRRLRRAARPAIGPPQRARVPIRRGGIVPGGTDPRRGQRRPDGHPTERGGRAGIRGTAPPSKASATICWPSWCAGASSSPRRLATPCVLS